MGTQDASYLFSYQEHSYYSADHKTLPIEDASTPERYSVEKCLTHKKQDVEEICKLCKKLFCDRCKTRELCPAVGQQGLYCGLIKRVVI